MSASSHTGNWRRGPDGGACAISVGKGNCERKTAGLGWSMKAAHGNSGADMMRCDIDTFMTPCADPAACQFTSAAGLSGAPRTSARYGTCTYVCTYACTLYIVHTYTGYTNTNIPTMWRQLRTSTSTASTLTSLRKLVVSADLVLLAERWRNDGGT